MRRRNFSTRIDVRPENFAKKLSAKEDTVNSAHHGVGSWGGGNMELDANIADLQSKLREHREVLATEEAAKTTLVLPFLRALGYDIFNPSEVTPEFTCDVGTQERRKGRLCTLRGR